MVFNNTHLVTPQAPTLIDRVREAIRVRHYSIRTEGTYIQWHKKFILFHNKRHPKELGEEEVSQFLTHLAINERVSASTQNLALNAIVFLYREVIKKPLGRMEDIVRAKGDAKISAQGTWKPQLTGYELGHISDARTLQSFQMEFPRTY